MKARGLLVALVGVPLLLADGGCSTKQPEQVEPPPPERVVAPGSVEDTIAIVNLQTSDSLIEGSLVNNSNRQIDEVHLLINHSFLWKNERNPGRNNPSRTEYYRVAKPIPAGTVMAFEYRPDPPLPKRTDGQFVTTVEVVSFAEIGR